MRAGKSSRPTSRSLTTQPVDWISFERRLNGFRQAIAFEALLGGFLEGNHHAAGLLDALGEFAELLFEFGELPARLDRLDQNRLELSAEALGIAQREDLGFVVSHVCEVVEMNRSLSRALPDE